MDSAASLRSCLASKIKSIDCTIKGKDGKPTKAFRNVSFEASKPDGCSRRPARYNGTKKPQSANISSTEVQVEDEDDDVEEVFVEDPRAGNGKHTDNA
ncbi:hypothetical protein Tco_0879554 [Tanacetum coccineum]